MSLAGKVAIVTGGTKGIGQAIAIKLQSQGAKVVVNYASDSKAASETIEKLGGEANALAVQADIAKVAECKKIVDATVEKFGKVDILVNNAGYLRTATVTGATEEQFANTFDINVKGTIFVTQFAVPHMAPGSRVINTSTSLTIGSAVRPDYALYVAAKGAIEQLSRSAAKELGPKGITVNVVSPGPVATELFLNTNTEQTINMIKGMSPFKRLGEPSDIANVVSFLASEESAWVSGQNIRANGAFII